MPTELPQNYAQLEKALQGFIPQSRLISDPLRTLAYGTDASFYRLIPKLVVEVENEAEVSQCLQLAQQHRTPVTFRAASTSLSGQSISDSVLIRLGWGWRDYQIDGDGSKIRLQPGVIGGDCNRYLAPYQRKIGPDPASINAAKIGGIAANNASGMCCGTAQNSYQTLHSMRLILADGSLLDTGDAVSREQFKTSHARFLEQLASLASETSSNQTLANLIAHKFKIKNTTGYSLNALIDFDDPIDILQHLLIGSEGTLGFIAEITYKTVVEHPYKASALMLFANIKSACDTVTLLKSESVSAVELMDRAAIRAVEDAPGMPSGLKTLPENAAALLVECRGSNSTELNRKVDGVVSTIRAVETLSPVEFTDIEAEYSKLWKIRKGLFPSVGAMRQPGTTVIIEDVAFPLPQLAVATLELQSLFKKYHYHEAIIFGHALEGNLHFVFTQDFGTQAEIKRYQDFMDEVCHLVVEKYDGSLKAEHGTGRNMAPYVELEWGHEAFVLMQRLKKLFDPNNLLNPGVILNDNPLAHINNLKPLPAVDPLIDKCIECGFCEPACPSRALTLSPRQRIVGLREIQRQATLANHEQEQLLRKAYQYQGIDTCAGDSLCSIACPVNIDTGYMIKTLRARQLGNTGQRIANWSANHFEQVCDLTRVSLGVANFHHKLLGSKLTGGLTDGFRKLSGKRIPMWNRYIPTAATSTKQDKSAYQEASPKVVYFPSCASRNMGPAKDDPQSDSLVDTTVALLEKAGFVVIFPDKLASLCCGMPFESKGAMDAAAMKQQETERVMLDASQQGRYPIVFDTSPCNFRMKQHLQHKLDLYDITEFIHDYLLPRLHINEQQQTIAIHPTCSIRKMRLDDKLQKIAEACAEKVILPDGISCCGWAGDKGFTTPELNASALINLKSALSDECQNGYSTSRTCEIGLSLHSGRHYRSIVYLVDSCTQPNHIIQSGNTPE